MSTIVNPFLGHRVSGAWTPAHQAVDYATPIGFRFVAPADGVYHRMPDELARTPGMAGRWGRLVLDDGRSITFCHLNRHIAHHGQRVTGGRTVLAETGNTGYVLPAPTRRQPWLGAHMHTYGLTARGRWGRGRWDWTRATAAPANVDPPTPLPTPDTTPDTTPEPAPEPEEEDDNMGFAFKVKDDNTKPYYWFNFARGKSRRLSSDEVVQMRSAERSGIPGNTIHEVGAGWYENQLKLGTYEQ